MKQYIFLLVVTFALFSCSSDDDNSEPAQGDLETLILGSWKIESKTLNSEALELDCVNGLSRIRTFRENDVSFGVDLEDGNGCVTIPFSATYSIDGNIVTINPPLGVTEIWTVISINETTFQFTYTRDNDDVYTETYQKI